MYAMSLHLAFQPGPTVGVDDPANSMEHGLSPTHRTLYPTTVFVDCHQSSTVGRAMSTKLHTYTLDGYCSRPSP